MKESKFNSVFKHLRDSYHIVPIPFRKKITISILFFVFNALLELITLASIIPFIILLISKKATIENPVLALLQNHTGFLLDENSILYIPLIFLLLIIIKNIIATYISHFQIHFSYKVANDISYTLFQKYFKQDYLQFTSGNSGIFSKEIGTIPIVFIHNILLSYIYIVSELIVMFLFSIGLILLNWKIFLVTALYLSITVIIILGIKNKSLKKISSRLDKLFSYSSKNLLMGIDSYVEAKLFRREKYFINNYFKSYKRQNESLASTEVIKSIPVRVLETAGLIGLIFLIYFNFSNAVGNSDLLITISFFIAMMYRLIPSFSRLITKVISIQSNSFSVGILKRLLFTNENEEENISEVNFKDQIKLNNISFAYEESRPVIKDINLHVKKGEIIGIFGPSGQGKSTLLKLLCGLISPVKGEFLIDGVMLQKSNTDSWFRKIGYVPQNPIVLDTSIAENITLGKTNKKGNIEKILNLLEELNLLDMVGHDEDNLFSEMGENGIKISGGQRKRLALARSLYFDPEILILDEVTSELDEASSIMVLQLLAKEAKKGKTVILVSHQLSNLSICDHIYQLKNGTLLSVGDNAIQVEKPTIDE